MTIIGGGDDVRWSVRAIAVLITGVDGYSDGIDEHW
jgi:hypothetical protein